MLKFLDIFFIIFHTSLIIFNLFGWIWIKTRKANLITLSLTFFAWFGLGIFYGIGFCPITEWHWQVLYKLGKTDLPNSYISYLITRLTGVRLGDNLVDTMTMILFLSALIISVVMNVRDYRAKKRRSIQ
jgi:hypothetical protein